MLVDFYQLGGSPIERVLPRICERLLEAGERILIVAQPEMIAGLDRQLWSYARDSFLPHGVALDPRAERQPILLSAEVAPANGANNIALADGRWRDEALGFDRVFYFFDMSHLDEARQSWRQLGGKPEIERRYWRQDDRRKWVQGP